MTVDEGTISIEERDHILLMGFDRPEKYNGYTPNMARELVDACVAALGPVQAELMSTDDAAEGVASFVERREANFVGH